MITFAFGVLALGAAVIALVLIIAAPIALAERWTPDHADPLVTPTDWVRKTSDVDGPVARTSPDALRVAPRPSGREREERKQ